MNKVNYDLKMQEEINKNKRLEVKPKLLLHACCAPCSSVCLERLKDYFWVTAYFYNPNMDTVDEYIKRLEEEKKLCNKFNIDLISEEYNHKEFLDSVLGFENYLEGDKRCFICYKLRLLKTANKAKEYGFDYFTTSLTLSPLKNAEVLNKEGEDVAKITGIKFLNSDFKKRGGYLRSIELSKEFDFYRQNYCGCEFSRTSIKG